MVYPMFFSPLGVAATHLDVHDVFRRRFSGGSTKALFGELRDVVQAACRWKWSLSGKWSSWGLSMAGWFSIVDLEWYRWPMSWGLSMVYCRWPIEIVDLPFLKMVIFQFVFCKRLPEGNWYQRELSMAGWWLTYPSEKWWSSSVGNMNGKRKHVPNHQPDGNFRILKWRYVSTIFLAIFSGDIPWN